jgi:tetratricopeptide (TPR) repeat protein
MSIEICYAIEPPEFFLKEGIPINTSEVEIIITDDSYDTSEMAITKFRKIIKYEPENIAVNIKYIRSNEKNLSSRELIDSYLNIAQKYEQYEMYEQAKIFYEKALSLDPSSEFLQKKVKTVIVTFSDKPYSYWSLIKTDSK